MQLQHHFARRVIVYNNHQGVTDTWSMKNWLPLRHHREKSLAVFLVDNKKNSTKKFHNSTFASPSSPSCQSPRPLPPCWGAHSLPTLPRSPPLGMALRHCTDAPPSPLGSSCGIFQENHSTTRRPRQDRKSSVRESAGKLWKCLHCRPG